MSSIDDQLDVIIDAHLRHLEGDGAAPDLTTLPDDIREEAQARLALLEAVWGAQVEPPVDDPVARRFGFDRASESIAIDGRRIATLRKSAGLNLAELLTLITTAGGTINAGDLFRLEQNSSSNVDQPTASALAAALGTPLADIEAVGQVDMGVVRAFLDSPAFHQMIDAWAAEHGVNSERAQRTVTERVLAAQYRAAGVTVDQLLEIVRAILDTLEP